MSNADVMELRNASTACDSCADSNFAVELSHIDKIFYTHHFFNKNEDTGKRKIYERKTIHAVRDVSFGIRKGEVLGLLGPNGAGKTTCVKMISGLVRPTVGKVYVQGMHVEQQRLKVLRRVGVVLEGTRTVIWPLTPYENLCYFGNLRAVRGPGLKKRAKELLDFIGLREKMHTQVRRLSRGQRQRLAICIALIADPSVILLDEPTTGLDVQSSRAIRQKVGEMTREMGKSVLVTTHDMNVAQQMCDRIGIIDKGRLVTCRPTAELLDVFADQTYELRLDPMPELAPLRDIPGVHHVSVEDDGTDGKLLLIRLADEESQRSEALYAVMSRLHDSGCILRNVTQRQQTLENVFVRLTESSI